MGWDLSLVVDRQEVISLRLAYSDSSEVDVLQEVFPKMYWTLSNPEAEDWLIFSKDSVSWGDPPSFDFIANEKKAKETMQDYLDKVTDDHTHQLSERQGTWLKDFWTVYRAGLALQRTGRITRVAIG